MFGLMFVRFHAQYYMGNHNFGHWKDTVSSCFEVANLIFL